MIDEQVHEHSGGETNTPAASDGRPTGVLTEQQRVILDFAVAHFDQGAPWIRAKQIAHRLLPISHAEATKECRKLVELGWFKESTRKTFRAIFDASHVLRVAEDGRIGQMAPDNLRVLDNARHAAQRADRAACRTKLLEYMKAQREKGILYIRVKDATIILGKSQTFAQTIIADLVADGSLVAGAHAQQGYRLAIPDDSSAPSVYLGELLAKARALTSSDAAPRAGRREGSQATNLQVLSPQQLDNIERLVELLVANHPKVSRRLADGTEAAGADAIDGRYLFWTDGAVQTTRGTSAGWALHRPVQRWVELQHELKHEERKREAEQRKARGLSFDESYLSNTWAPAMAAQSVEKYRSAVNNLLNLAATHVSEEWPALISPSPRIKPLAQQGTYAGNDQPRYHAHWTPIIPRWARALEAQHRKRGNKGATSYRFFTGLAVIAEAATRVVEQRYGDGLAPVEAFDPYMTDWTAVREQIEADELAGWLAAWKAREARAAWRQSYELIANRIGNLCSSWNTWRWPGQHEDREALVSHAAQRAAAIPAEHQSRDFSGWVDRDGVYLQELVEGDDYGVRQYLTWATAPAHQLGSASSTLPARRWGLPLPSGRKRDKEREVPAQLREESVKGYLAMLSRLLGWCAKHRNMQWSSSGFDALVRDASIVIDYVTELQSGDPRRRNSDNEDRSSSSASTLLLMIGLSNGWFWCRADQLRQRESELAGKAGGDKERKEHERRAEKYADDLRAFENTYRRLHEHLAKISSRDEISYDARIGRYAAQVAKIAAAWKGDDGVSGLIKLRMLRDAVLTDVVRAGGGLSIEAQGDAIRRGQFKRTLDWATHVQFATMLTLLTRIPMRAGTLRNLRMDMLRFTGGEGDFQASALNFDIPKQVMKAKRDFTPSWIQPDEVGNDVHEAALCRPLLVLYFGEGGAREFACSETDAETGATTAPKRRRIPKQGTGKQSSAGRRHLAEIPWVFPALGVASDNESRSGRWETGDLTRMLGAAIRRHGKAIGVNPRVLAKVRGALGMHVIRKLFGSFWAGEQGMLVYASALLHHKNVAVTADRYCAQSESSITLEVGEIIMRDLKAREAEDKREMAAARRLADALDMHGRAIADERAEKQRAVDELNSKVSALEAENATLRASLTAGSAVHGRAEHDEAILTIVRSEGLSADDLRQAVAAIRMLRPRAA